jgi:hypothetical protein
MTAPPAVPKAPGPYAYTPPPTDDSANITKWARIGLTVLLIPLGMSAFKDQYGYIMMIGDINAAIHEFGHMLFQPFGWALFGETAVVLGGSLTQVAFPCVFVGYFLFNRKHRDIHAATVCLWWVSINLLEVSIYAADARAGVLQLINGLTGQDEDSGHDFQYLFRHWGVMNKDTLYAGRMRAIAGLLFSISIAGGIWTVIQSKASQKQTADD